MGKYPILKAILLIFFGLNAWGAVHYVDRSSTKPIAPYTNWLMAAHTIQDAVDVAGPGDTVLVTNGVYATGGQIANPLSSLLTNRVTITVPLRLESINGPSSTIIAGHQPLGQTGDAAIRCVYLVEGAVLSGFTITNGGTRSLGDAIIDQSGGGVMCQGSAVISNCVVTGNAASYFGGGTYGGTLSMCILAGNSAYLEGGGGAYAAQLNDCKLTGNSAHVGGGACYGTLRNCTVVDNWAFFEAGGAYEADMANCIVYYNQTFQPPLPNGVSDNYWLSTLNHCCTTPMPDIGVGNLTNLPLFVDLAITNLQLQSTSPCINAGDNSIVGGSRDLHGNPRIRGGTVDIGAIEFQNPTSTISYAWLEQYGFTIDGSADFTDPDSDGMNNWQEWIAGTNPTNSASALRMLPPTNTSSGTEISWLSVSDRNYILTASTNPATAPFSILAANIPGQSNATTYVDTNAAGVGSFFYRVGVLAAQ